MIDPQFHWGLMIRLAVMHFVLLTLACYAPVAIVLYFWGFPSHFATYWLSQYMSLQLPCLWLLAVFWSISRCEWRQRTFLAVVGYLTIGLHATAPSMVMLVRNNGNFSSVIADLERFASMFQVLVGESLLIAVFFDLFRSFCGSLTREKTGARERLTILTIKRMIVITAVVLVLFYNSGMFSEFRFTLKYVGFLILQAIALASCIWMFFGPRHNWVGFISILLHIILGILMSRGDYKHMAIFALTQAISLYGTLAVIRYYGFRLQKFDSDSMHVME